ncbi:MAG TPA: NAD(P)/FAD-dependent oxidoreductase [Terracidiphilus sp.]|nr:NAD(P)/FAD-dependent oxidoreductase [Terracidiphilus sp.]
MARNGKKIVIIGSGIAGLSAAVYALKCGYDVEVVEMNDQAGGLAMSWKRGPYTFETCLHWLLGSKPGADLHAQWEEIFEIDRLRFVNPDRMVQIEDPAGRHLTIYTNLQWLETELLRRTPQDAKAIHEFVDTVRALERFRMLDPAGGLAENWQQMLHDLPMLPLLRKLINTSGAEYAKRFSDPMLQAFFSGGDMGQLSAIALLFSLAWMHAGNAGYAIGGSQAIIRLIEEQIASLGGNIRFRAKVVRILVENDAAVGVELESGEKIMADWVVSAADGHATIFDMLGGKYADAALRKAYNERLIFTSYAQVSLGVAMDLSGQPPMVTRILEKPFRVDPKTELPHMSFRFFHFDPTFAPEGKTAVTSFLPTRNYGYWMDLRVKDPAGYHEEKQRLAKGVIDELEKRIPGVREAIEATDVSTPASVVRHTGNWKGSMEGWMIVPGMGLKTLPNTLPGLGRFVMVGQWVLPGGGLPCGPMTARPAVKQICRQDRVPFMPQMRPEAIPA